MSDYAEREPAGVERRPQSLEAQIRALRRLMILTVVALLVAMAVLARWVVVRTYGKARFKSVEAEHFVVRDSLKERRGELGMWNGIVRLTLGGDERSARGIAMGSGPSIRPQIVLKDGEGGAGLLLSSKEIHFDQRFGGGPGALYTLRRGVPMLYVIDSSGRVFIDSLRLRR